MRLLEPAGHTHRITQRALSVYAAALLGVLALLAYYAFSIGTGRSDWLAVAQRARAWGGEAGSLPLLSLCYYLGSLLSLPGLVMLTILVTCLGAYQGIIVVVLGTAASSSTIYLLAKRLGRGMVAELYPQELARVEEIVRGPAFLRVLQARLLPVLPFHLVNAACGLLGIPLRSFLAGTVVGLLPKMLVQLYFVRTLLGGLTAPGRVVAINAAVSMCLFVIVTVVGVQIERHIRSARPPETTDRP